MQNIFRSGELDEGSNVQKMHFAHATKPVTFCNLDVIISVGYRGELEGSPVCANFAHTVTDDETRLSDSDRQIK